MNIIGKGMAAGFVATLALSTVMVIKTMMGVMPELNAIKMLTTMAHDMMGTPLTPLIGWMLHFIIGTVLWGGLYAYFYNKIPGSTAIQKSIVFSIFAWILMMIGPMVMAGQGLFGLRIGIMAPVATLMLHLIYGIVMGAVFAKRV